MKSKPKRLIKSYELASLDGVRELSFGGSSAETRMNTRSSAKNPREVKHREYADEKARNTRFGIV